MVLVVVSASLILMLNILYLLAIYSTVHAQPSIIDSSLNVKAVVEGLSSPTSMIFLGDNNMLILEKDGQVRLVSNGILQEQPVLQVSVNTESERGLLGITTSNGSGGQGTTNVFLYYTEGDPLRNRVYKYQWNGQSLNNPI